ncbi:uncharacterized protein LOC113306088 [Papaver somniferum]|uniref:uncharacterized protein LOC113306088 n=1 Tax=Papaver somniferum TaxID=3469 RepID=UPI000E700B70|nr:uncharacterized protein LOC113306088 [Papaver somniferum]
MNKALHWIWRYGSEKFSLWRRIINQKFGGAEDAFLPALTRNSICHSVWKGILKAREFVKAGTVLNIGSGACMYFWDDVWIGEFPLKQLFPSLFVIARQKHALISELISSEGAWILNFSRNLNDQEMLEVANLLQIIGDPSRLVNEDSRQ